MKTQWPFAVGCPELDVLTGNNDLGLWDGAQHVVRGTKFGAFPARESNRPTNNLKSLQHATRAFY